MVMRHCSHAYISGRYDTLCQSNTATDMHAYSPYFRRKCKGETDRIDLSDLEAFPPFCIRKEGWQCVWVLARGVHGGYSGKRGLRGGEALELKDLECDSGIVAIC